MTFFARAKWLAIKTVFCGGINNGIGQALLLCAMLAPLAIVAGCAGVVSGSTQTQPPPPASYTVTGTISPTVGGNGATVTLSGGANATTTANSSGVFTFTSIADGTYTLTPSKTGFTFTPTSLNITVSGGNVSGIAFTDAVQTFGISGTISPTAGGNGATVTLSGAGSATTTANSSGAYSFTGLADGTYTIRPSKTGYTFNPGSLNATVNGVNVTGINFTDTAVTNPTFSISGTISSAANGSGATVTLSGAANGTTTANGSGNYTFTGLANGTYTVTPSKTGFTFSPTSLNATVNGANVTGVNFTATAQTNPTYTISGTITGGSGVAVTLSGAASGTTTANGSGNYSFSGLANGSYTITPSEAGFSFNPGSTNATVNGANVTGVNFTATATSFSLSGTISPAAGGSGATVTLSGAANATTTANGSGNYSFTGLANGSYTVTPSKSGFTFTPASANATVNGANVTGVNFTAVAPTFTVSGTITPTAGGSGATVTLSGAANASTTTDGSGNYTFTSVSNGSYTLTPSNSGYTFTPASQPVTVNGANVTGVNFTAQVAVQAAAGAPVLFFSDLTSGPATGNSDTTYSTNGGVYVTLYGNFFGAVQGTSSVSLNGGSCLKVVSWGTPWLWYQKIVVQLTSSCASGNFTVTTSLGTSNGLSFAVRSGNIHFISGSGSDSASGSFTAPWRTINHAASTMAAGDTSYAQTGSDDTTDDGSGWSTSLLINSSGSASAPISLVAYPGASVTIGSSSVSNSIRSGRTIPTNYWNVAGFTLVGGGSVLASWGSNYWRMVGNDMSCPNGNGAGGCYVPIETTFLYTYGNNIHNTGVSGASAEYHAVYLATDSNDQDFGWNEIAFVNGGRGLQTHSAPNGGGTLGYSLFNMSIHDNIIHDTDLDCIVADTLSPNAGGPVTIYNNVFYNCGTTTPPEGTGGWSGINIPGYTEAGPTSAGTVEIFNNTFYAYGLNTNPPYGGQENGIVWNGSGSSMSVHVRNNLLYSVTTSVFPSGVPYFAPSGSAQIYGVNNLVFGAGTSSGNSSITNSVSANPLLTNVTGFNFLPLTGSPAIGAGSPITGLTPFGINNIGRDINGNPRPATPSIGAYE